MIQIENLKAILFFSFKIDQLFKIASLFFAFESDKNIVELVVNFRFFTDYFLSDL
jgi:hypothetical protein